MKGQESGGDSTRVRVPAQSAQKIPDRYRASIVILDGYAEGMEYPLTKAHTVIGRDKTADIPVKDALISRQHASISFDDGAFILKDMGSTNGTLHNGRLVEQARLQNRDRVQVGDTTIQFILEDSGAGKVFEIK